jgi:DNA invertase Pin-like site-specific DNA recombinase
MQMTNTATITQKEEGTLNRSHKWQETIRRLAVGYVRVSTPGQGHTGVSLDAQRNGIKAYSDIMGYTVIEVFEDVASGVGEKSFAKRDGLRHAIELTVQEDADLIVWDWDRLTRHAGFEADIRKKIPERERIVCAKNVNTLREAARAAAFAYSEKVAQHISKTTIEGMARRSAEGVVFGNPDIKTNVQPLGAISWANSAGDLVRRIADVLRELDDDPFKITHAQAADILNAKNLRTLHGKEWNKSRIRNPLKKARAVLKEDDEAEMRLNPRFGIF